MRCIVLLLCCLLLSGCANLLNPPASADNGKKLHAALAQLVDKDNAKPMQALAAGDDRALAKDARLILKLHTEARTRKQSDTEKALAALKEENRQLKVKLDELSQLHLELDRKVP